MRVGWRRAWAGVRIRGWRGGGVCGHGCARPPPHHHHPRAIRPSPKPAPAWHPRLEQLLTQGSCRSQASGVPSPLGRTHPQVAEGAEGGPPHPGLGTLATAARSCCRGGRACIGGRDIALEVADTVVCESGGGAHGLGSEYEGGVVGVCVGMGALVPAPLPARTNMVWPATIRSSAAFAPQHAYPLGLQGKMWGRQ